MRCAGRVVRRDNHEIYGDKKEVKEDLKELKQDTSGTLSGSNLVSRRSDIAS